MRKPQWASWLGGITEARRVVAMASAYDVAVIPHGSSVYSYHLQYAFSSCPMAEYLVLSPEADKIVPLFGNLFTNEPLPKDGYIDLPDRPGFGVELNRAELDLRRPHPHTPLSAEEVDSAKRRAPTREAWMKDPVSDGCGHSPDGRVFGGAPVCARHHLAPPPTQVTDRLDSVRWGCE